MKRMFLLTALLVLAVSGAVFAQDVDPTGVTVTYWHQYSEGSAQGDAMAALVEEFNSNNEFGITVDAQFQGGYDEIRELMNGAIISGETPNLVAGYQEDMTSYELDDVVVDLNNYLMDENWGYTEEEMADLNQGALDVNVFEFEPFNGAMLGWPNQISGTLMVANLSMFEELGFDAEAPADFDTFFDIACEAAESDLTGAEGIEVQGYPIKADSSNYESYLASFGGSMYEPEANEYDFTTDAAIEAFALYAELYAEGCAYIPDSRFGNTDDFALGANPMAITSIAGLPFIESGFEASGVEADWTITTTPWTEGNRAFNVFIPSIIMIEGTTEENVASWLFLKFLAEEESQYAWSTQTQYLSMNISAASRVAEDVAESNPLFAAVIEIFNDPDVVIYSSPNVPSYGSIRDLIATAMADVTLNGMDVDEVAEALTEEANEVHESMQ